jgi:uncharacterized membrane protein YphA (DoxX/SURF4 family)
MSTVKQTSTGLNALLWFLRIFVGVLFILSGYYKLIDPHGLQYKMEEFFELKELHMALFYDYALLFSVLMIAFEIIAGVALIIGYRFRLFSFLLLVLIIFFTFLTAYAHFSGKIKECGCFGNCIKLKSFESFIKDIVLLGLILIIFAFRNRIQQAFSNKLSNILMLITVLVSFGIQIWVLQHGPFHDCLPYKKGNSIAQKMQPGADYKPAVFDNQYFYKNLKTGEKKAFKADNLPWQDSLTWKYDTMKNVQISDEMNGPEIKDFAIISYSGADITQEVLAQPAALLYIAKDISKAAKENTAGLKKLTDAAIANGVKVYGLSASMDTECMQFVANNKLGFEFNIFDGVVCKTAMRANSGIIMLRNGIVTYKCTYADYPAYEKLK